LNRWADSLWRTAAGLCVVGLLAIIWSAVGTAPGNPWNPARIAASFALARGLDLYPSTDAGAQVSENKI
jgi:hypothetical protein